VLSRLSKVELRDVWGHEAIDFTNWLAQKENLDVLSEEIGIDIKLIKTEASVGKFSVDILAEEEASGRKIIIENQNLLLRLARFATRIIYFTSFYCGSFYTYSCD
jgi:hypothetical protein